MIQAILIIVLIIFIVATTFLWVRIIKIKKERTKLRKQLIYTKAREVKFVRAYQDLYDSHTTLCSDFKEWFRIWHAFEKKKKEANEIVTYASNELVSKMEFVQLMTGAESLQELVLQALILYLYAADRRSEGVQLFVGRTLAKATPLQFEPLTRIKSRVNN